IVADYFIGKSLVFAKKTLQPDEFALYSRLYTIINTTLPPPDLMVYLYMGIDQLQENIRKRGRSYEQEIPDEYLKQIQESYFEFMQQREDLRIVVIDANDIDFVKNHADYETLKRIIFDSSYDKGIHRIKP
ncbi:MAG: deoxynucleoside kinase, partial [Bacteroidales bacterium]|nr:deoxynucleoside kinase [Bacteroidales bacterium]